MFPSGLFFATGFLWKETLENKGKQELTFRLTAVVLCLLPAITAAQHSGPAVKDKFIAGVCTHLADGSRPLDESIGLIKEAGANSIRDEIFWSNVERVKDRLSFPSRYEGYLNEALDSELAPVVILDYGNRFYGIQRKPVADSALTGFLRYAAFVVNHYKGKVHYYEIWNEWDLTGDPTSAESYFNFVRSVYPAIKSIDSSATVLVGSVTTKGINDGWLQRLVSLGVLNYSDGISIHPYIHCNSADEKTPEYWISWLRGLTASLRIASGNRPINLCITEMGWPTNQGACHTDTGTSAKFLARMYLLAKTETAIKGVWWYDFQNDGTDSKNREDNCGLVGNDLAPKPSYWAFQDIAALVEKSEFIKNISNQPGVYALEFENKDSTMELALWLSASTATKTIKLHFAGPNVTSVIVKKVGTREGSTRVQIDIIKKDIEIKLGDMPLLIEVPQSEVEIE